MSYNEDNAAKADGQSRLSFHVALGMFMHFPSGLCHKVAGFALACGCQSVLGSGFLCKQRESTQL